MKIYFLLSLFLLTGCSYYLELNKGEEIKYLQEPKTFNLKKCKKKTLYFSESNNAFELYQKLTKKIPSNLNFTDKILLWTMTHVALRPDTFRYNSRLFFIMRLNNKNYFFDFKGKKYGIREALSYINSFQRKPARYQELMSLSQKYIPRKVSISSQLSDFLAKQTPFVSNDEKFSEKFFRKGERLISGESFTRDSFRPFYKVRRFNPKTLSLPVFPYSKEMSCNFEMKEYEKGQYFIRPKDGVDSSFIGLKEKNGNFFLALAISGIEKDEEGLLKLVQSKAQKHLCHSPNKENFLFSFRSRDPGQILHNLKNLPINSSNDLKKAIEFPRFIYLETPERIIFESEKGNLEQLDNLYSTERPLYHVDSLGEIWGGSSSSIVPDSRSQTEIQCLL